MENACKWSKRTFCNTLLRCAAFSVHNTVIPACTRCSLQSSFFLFTYQHLGEVGKIRAVSFKICAPKRHVGMQKKHKWQQPTIIFWKLSVMHTTVLATCVASQTKSSWEAKNASAKTRLHLNQTSQAENCRRVFILKTGESQEAKETPDSQWYSFKGVVPLKRQTGLPSPAPDTS